MIRPEDLLPAQRSDLLRAFADHGTFCKEGLRLPDRLGQIVPLEQWPSQRKQDLAIRRQQRAGRPVRLLELKTRRSGFTVGSCSHLFKETGFLPGRRAVIIADKYDPAALEAYGYLRSFTENYVPIERHGAQINQREMRAVDMSLMEGKDPVVQVYSAEGGEVRGGGVHWLLADEQAFWRDAQMTLRGALNMVPDLPETGIIIQSTANGTGGDFYERWQAAMDPLNDGGWETLFFGWLEDANNTKRFESDAQRLAFKNSLDKEELLLQRLHNASLEQLHWRSWKIATSSNGRVDDFHQEYPTTPEEAFLVTGRPALDHAAIARQPVMEGTTGELHQTEDYPNPRLIFTARDHGALIIWRMPERGHWYVIGADPSRGIDVSDAKRGDDPDYFVAIVLDGETGEQVAQFRERLRPGPAGEVLAMLGRWYHWAFLVPESNDPGFVDSILKSSYPMERMYRMQRDPTDRRTGSISELGYYETEVSRRWLIAAIDEALRKGDIGLHSAVAVQECRTFVIKPNGKAEHQNGCHDDCVFAAGLAVMGRATAPRSMMTRSAVDTAAQARPGRWGGGRDQEVPERVYRR